jgi:hypothetical protein
VVSLSNHNGVGGSPFDRLRANGGAGAWLEARAPFDSAPFDSAPFDSAPFDSAPFDSAPFDSAPFDSAALTRRYAQGERPGGYAQGERRVATLRVNGRVARRGPPRGDRPGPALTVVDAPRGHSPRIGQPCSTTSTRAPGCRARSMAAYSSARARFRVPQIGGSRRSSAVTSGEVQAGSPSTVTCQTTLMPGVYTRAGIAPRSRFTPPRP